MKNQFKIWLVCFLCLLICFTSSIKIVDDRKSEQIISEQSKLVETETTIEETEPQWTEVVATAYCSCEKCCGKYAKNRPKDRTGKSIVKGASGKVLKQGYSVAADPKIFPMGTQLEIENYGIVEVQDVGGKVKGNRIDIYFENHNDAVKFGKQILKIREVK